MKSVIPPALLAALSLAGCAPSDVMIANTYYAPEYDYGEFHAATDGRNFQVILAGNPFPQMSDAEMKRQLLPILQANKPPSNLTFTYEAPPERPRPHYRVVLVFDPANDLTAARVCASEIRHKPRDVLRPIDVFGVYCRNELALSQTEVWTAATSPDDPRVAQVFALLFVVLFNDSPAMRWRSNPFFNP